MTAMSIGEFKKLVGEAIERVESGEVIEITRNERTIAELRPRRGASQTEWNAARRRMIDAMRRGFDLGGTQVTAEDKYGDARL